MKFVNLTPHQIKIITEKGPVTIDPSGNVGRISVTTVTVATLDGIDIVDSRLGEPIGIPEPQDGVGYIVSTMVRTAMWDRDDLFSPGDLVRDLEGKPIGCQSLTCNPTYRIRQSRRSHEGVAGETY